MDAPLITNERRNLWLELNPSYSWVSKPRARATIYRMPFPAPVPEIPAANVDKAAAYYVNTLCFTFDWGDDRGGIAGISRGIADCLSPIAPSESTSAT